MSLLTLTTDSDARKRIPLIGGLWGYFAAALVGVAQHSFKSNEKHNPGQPLHWSFDKSKDHAECCGRHLLDLSELEALLERGGYTQGEAATEEVITSILDEANAHAWRALALSQTLHMKYRGAPLPFNAKRDPKPDPLSRGAELGHSMGATEPSFINVDDLQWENGEDVQPEPATPSWFCPRSGCDGMYTAPGTCYCGELLYQRPEAPSPRELGGYVGALVDKR